MCNSNTCLDCVYFSPLLYGNDEYVKRGNCTRTPEFESCPKDLKGCIYHNNKCCDSCRYFGAEYCEQHGVIIESHTHFMYCDEWKED